MEPQTKKDVTDEYRRLEQGIYGYYDALVRQYNKMSDPIKDTSDNPISSVLNLQRMSIDASIAIIDARRKGSIDKEELDRLDNLLGTVFGIQDKLGEFGWSKMEERLASKFNRP